MVACLRSRRLRRDASDVRKDMRLSGVFSRTGSHLVGAVSVFVVALVLGACVANAAEHVTHRHHGCLPVTSDQTIVAKPPVPSSCALPIRIVLQLQRPAFAGSGPRDNLLQLGSLNFRDTSSPRSPPLSLRVTCGG